MNQLDFTAIADEYWIIAPPAPLPYVSLNAIKRVRDPLPKPTVCPACGGSVKLVNNREIYGKSIGNWPFAYHCQKCCEVYVGVHPDTDIPVGYMADKALRKARQAAKVSFHEMLDVCQVSRTDGYKWLAKRLGKLLNQTHYGWMDAATCAQAMAATDAEIQKCRKS